MTAGYFAVCTCPPVWHGVVRPPCAVHNPAALFTVTTYTASNTATVEWKPRGRGRRFDRLARGLARRLRIPWARSTLRARDNPQASDHAEAYAPVWTSANALADYSFACVCHKRPRYRDRRQPKHKEGTI